MSSLAGVQTWRDGARYRYVHDLDRAGFAWELLRRNAAYRAAIADHQALSDIALDADQIEAPPGEGRRWGLCFPDPGRIHGDRSAAILAFRNR